MAKLRPKQSWALRREMQVRQALGGRTKWARGYRGAKRAEAELQARAQAARRRAPNWLDIPIHVQTFLIELVSFSDLHSMRLAGLGANDRVHRERMRSVYIRRRNDLQEIADLCMDSSRSSSHSIQHAHGGFRSSLNVCCRLQYDPVEFSKLTKLSMNIGGYRDETGSPAIPKGIVEMRHLEHLQVQSDSVIKSLPFELVACSKLKDLDISGHAFETLPDVILSLPRLKVLSIAKCNNLRELPDDIGSHLLSLQRLDMRDCDHIKKLPKSLLDRLELSSASCPLRLRTSCFETGYIERTITQALYPTLWACVNRQNHFF